MISLDFGWVIVPALVMWIGCVGVRSATVGFGNTLLVWCVACLAGIYRSGTESYHDGGGRKVRC
jgi:hypothetical protein